VTDSKHTTNALRSSMRVLADRMQIVIKSTRDLYKPEFMLRHEHDMRVLGLSVRQRGDLVKRYEAEANANWSQLHAYQTSCAGIDSAISAIERCDNDIAEMSHLLRNADVARQMAPYKLKIDTLREPYTRACERYRVMVAWGGQNPGPGTPQHLDAAISADILYWCIQVMNRLQELSRGRAMGSMFIWAKNLAMNAYTHNGPESLELELDAIENCFGFINTPVARRDLKDPGASDILERTRAYLQANDRIKL
jgi:hypothetical protein